MNDVFALLVKENVSSRRSSESNMIAIEEL
jgi:hypothetical protein